MSFTLGTDSNTGVPISYAFSFNGANTSWGSNHLYRVGDLGNSSEPVNKKRKIPSMSVTFIDPDASIWGSLGNGTTAFNKEFSGTVFIGGEMGSVKSDAGTRVKLLSLTGANSFNVFSGHIDRMSRSNNLTTIHAKNKFRYLNELKWQQPILKQSGVISNASGSTADTTLLEYDWLLDECGWNEDTNSEEKNFVFNALIVYTPFSLNPYVGTGLYDTTSDGIEPMLNSESGYDYQFTNSLFAIEQTVTKMKFLESGQIQWLNGTADTNANFILPMKKIRLAGDPIAVLKHCIFGKMVTDYLDYSTDTGNTFAEAQRVSAFKYYNQTINPDDSDNVISSVDDLLETEEALFYISTDNKFEVEPYSPKDLSAVLPELTGTDITSAETSNDVADYYNRIELNYNYNFSDNQYINKLTGTMDDWTVLNDLPLVINSKWIKNGNQAKASLSRILARYRKTNPKINFSAQLGKAGLEVGTLVKITDSQSNLSETVVQVTEYNKGFSSNKQIRFKGWNGDAMWRQRGYGRWTGTTGIVDTGAIGGWGTLFNQTVGIPFTGVNGTVHNINGTLYGTVFNFW